MSPSNSTFDRPAGSHSLAAAGHRERSRAEEGATSLSRSKGQRHGLPVWSIGNIKAVFRPGRGRRAPVAARLAPREPRVPYR